MSREFLTPLDLLSDVANCSLEVDSLDHSIIVSGSLIRLGNSIHSRQLLNRAEILCSLWRWSRASKNESRLLPEGRIISARGGVRSSVVCRRVNAVSASDQRSLSLVRSRCPGMMHASIDTARRLGLRAQVSERTAERSVRPPLSPPGASRFSW